ncbi:dienelactone hydrolase [Colletotrichum graminicola]|uniref:Dienelactone hydrolase n=1 Tax=Colletotrichum graminicola (strain M1.001 / M2 / FGSC 10212) TaxID=645133 RepID=E3QKI8_COLGM|nr:dienelactone hydrolase [Colletotrichum graminicola M1.001]EFQ31376.1 dienelactone hydrolase [Colletotrichum graminicola M1.001]WDK19652.1 dienelactone hydrolase [Colletotrichum graminicola]
MASNPPGQCCLVGVKHEGTPQGKKITVAGKYEGYLAEAPADKAHKSTGILYIADVFGIWTNSQLQADQFAANGYTTLIVDLFNKDQLSMPLLEGLDIGKWIAEGSDGKNPHTKEAVDPIIVDSIKYMHNELGLTNIGAVGYCFGAKFVVRHFKDGIKVGYLAHPSFVEEEELAAITGPLSIAAAETDSIFPTEKRHKSEEILQKTGLPYQINLYSGVEHGFAVRCDLSKKVQKYAKENAFLQAVTWFNEHLL